MAQAFDHEASVIHAITIHDSAAVENQFQPFAWQQKWPAIQIPEMIVGHKSERINAKTEIHVQSYRAIEIQTHARLVNASRPRPARNHNPAPRPSAR